MNPADNHKLKPRSFEVEGNLAAFEQAKLLWHTANPNASEIERERALRRIALDYGQAVAVPFAWPEGGK